MSVRRPKTKSKNLKEAITGRKSRKITDVTSRVRNRHRPSDLAGLSFDLTDEMDNKSIGNYIFVDEKLSKGENEEDVATFILEISPPPVNNKWKKQVAKNVRGEEYMRLKVADSIGKSFLRYNKENRNSNRDRTIYIAPTTDKFGNITSQGRFETLKAIRTGEDIDFEIEEIKNTIESLDGLVVDAKARIDEQLRKQKKEEEQGLIFNEWYLNDAKNDFKELNKRIKRNDKQIKELQKELSETPDRADFLESNSVTFTPNLEDSTDDVQLFDIRIDLTNNPDFVERFAQMSAVSSDSYINKDTENLDRIIYEGYNPDTGNYNRSRANNFEKARSWYLLELQNRNEKGDAVSDRQLEQLSQDAINKFFKTGKTSRDSEYLRSSFEVTHPLPFLPLPDYTTMQMFKDAEILFNELGNQELAERSEGKDSSEYIQPDKLFEQAMEDVKLGGVRGIPEAYHDTYRTWYYQGVGSRFRERLEELSTEVEPSTYRNSAKTQEILPDNYIGIDIPDAPLMLEINANTTLATLRGTDVQSFTNLLMKYGEYAGNEMKKSEQGNVMADLQNAWVNPLMFTKNEVLNLPIGLAYGFTDWIETGQHYDYRKIGTSSTGIEEVPFADSTEIGDETEIHIPIVDKRKAGDDIDGDLVTFNKDIGLPIDFANYQYTTIDRAVQKRMGTIQIPTGGGKCCIGETLVLTENGMVEIGSLFETKKNESTIPYIENIETFDFTEFKKGKSSHLYQKKNVPIITIDTKLGIELGATPHHRIVILDKYGNLSWKYMKDMQIGDIVVVRYGSDIYSKNIKLPIFNYEHEYHSTMKDVHIPTEMSNKLSYNMGLLIGDGSFRLKQPTSIRFSNNHKTLNDIFTSNMKDVYDVGFKQYTNGQRVIDTQIHSLRVREHLLSLGMTNKLAYEKEVPYTILRADKENQMAFLRGLFDADGSITLDGVITISTSSPKLAKQIHMMLMNVGIVSRKRIKKTKKRDHYILRIYKDFNQTYADNIGFSHLNKSERLTRSLSTERNTNINLIPLIADKLKALWNFVPHKIYKKHGIVGNQNGKIGGFTQKTIQSYFYGYRNIPPHKLKAILDGLEEIYPTIVQEEYFNDLYTLTNGLFFTRIKSITKSIDDVYDFVIPNTHSFTANAIINHNTEVGAGIFSEIDKKGIFLVHTRELAQQARERFKDRLRVMNKDLNLKEQNEIKDITIILRDTTLPQDQKIQLQNRYIELYTNKQNMPKVQILLKKINNAKTEAERIKLRNKIADINSREVRVGIISGEWLPNGKKGSATPEDDISVMLFGSGGKAVAEGVMDLNDVDSVFTKSQTNFLGQQQQINKLLISKEKINNKSISDDDKKLLLSDIDKQLTRLGREDKTDNFYQKREKEIQKEIDEINQATFYKGNREDDVRRLRLQVGIVKRKHNEAIASEKKREANLLTKKFAIIKLHKDGDITETEKQARLKSLSETIVEQRNIIVRDAIDRAGIVIMDEVHHVPADTFTFLQEKILSPYRFGLCISEDSYVLTTDGIVQIGTLQQTKEKETYVSFDKTIETFDFDRFYEAKTSYLYQRKNTPVKCIETKHGYELKGTPHHRIIILDKNGELNWKYMEQLEIGDHAVMRVGSNMFSKNDVLPPFQYEYSKQTTNLKEIIIPTKSSEELGYIMGLLVGDGTIAGNRSVRLSASEPTIIFNYSVAVNSVYGVEPVLAQNTIDARIYSRKIREHLISLGVSPKLSSEKEIPHTVLEGTEIFQTSFLKGLFDADGCVSNRSIEYYSTSKKMIKQLQIMLLNFNIFTSKYTKDEHPSFGKYISKKLYRLSISDRDSVQTFYNIIGFNHNNRKIKLEKIITNYDLVKRNDTKIRVIPNINKILKNIWFTIPLEIRQANNIVDNTTFRRDKVKIDDVVIRSVTNIFYSTQAVPTHKLRKILALIEKIYPLIINNDEFLKLEILCNGMVFESITSISDGIEDVYDFHVPNTHSFTANGMINHNSATPWREPDKSSGTAMKKSSRTAQTEDEIELSRQTEWLSANRLIVGENEQLIKQRIATLQKTKKKASTIKKKEIDQQIAVENEAIKLYKQLYNQNKHFNNTTGIKREQMDEIRNNINNLNWKKPKGFSSEIAIADISGEIFKGTRLSGMGTFSQNPKVAKSSKMIEASVGGFITRMWASQLMGSDSVTPWLVQPEIMFLEDQGDPFTPKILSDKDPRNKVYSQISNPYRSREFAKSMKYFDERDKDSLVIATEKAQLTSLRDALMRENVNSILVFRGSDQKPTSIKIKVIPKLKKGGSGEVQSIAGNIGSITPDRWKETDAKFDISSDFAPKSLKDVQRAVKHLSREQKEYLKSNNYKKDDKFKPVRFDPSINVKYIQKKSLRYRWEQDPKTKKMLLVPDFNAKGEWKPQPLPDIYQAVKLPSSYTNPHEFLSKGAIPIAVSKNAQGSFTVEVEDGKLGEDLSYYGIVEVPREEVLDMLQDTNPDVTLATSLADEGLDAPHLMTVALTDGSASQTKIFQRIGRGIRPKKEERKLKADDRKLKKFAVIVDMEEYNLVKKPRKRGDDRDEYEKTDEKTHAKKRKEIIEKYETKFNINTGSDREPLTSKHVKSAMQLQTDNTLPETSDKFRSQPSNRLPKDFDKFKNTLPPIKVIERKVVEISHPTPIVPSEKPLNDEPRSKPLVSIPSKPVIKPKPAKVKGVRPPKVEEPKLKKKVTTSDEPKPKRKTIGKKGLKGIKIKRRTGKGRNRSFIK